jgi:hypothetical protein
MDKYEATDESARNGTRGTATAASLPLSRPAYRSFMRRYEGQATSRMTFMRCEIMKNLLSIPILFLLACAQAPPSTVAIRGVTVVNVMDGSLRPEHTGLVTGNRITAVGAADQIRTPDDADLVDGAGGFLIPGLWDMHVHSVANVTWDMRVGSIGNAEWHFPLFLAHGVTSVRNMNDASASRRPGRGLGTASAVDPSPGVPPLRRRIV